MIEIDSHTVKDPISLMGRMTGACYGSDTSDPEKNYKRGLNEIKSNHGRCFEYAEVWFVATGYSAKMVRELYTHIGGAPTRTQASTRYIDYGSFDYVTPHTIERDDAAEIIYNTTMRTIRNSIKKLESIGIPKEDANMILPLGMTTTVSCRFNARTLISMSEQRMCNRAYWEYREFMKDLADALWDYSDEWATIVDTCFMSKCDKIGACPELHTCGKYPRID
jgi:thymidylate synthase (FAD)